MTFKTADRPTPQRRQEMIAIAAYYLAERRDFAPGEADTDWFCAEGIIDAMIANHRLENATGCDHARASIRNALRLHDAAMASPMRV